MIRSNVLISNRVPKQDAVYHCKYSNVLANLNRHNHSLFSRFESIRMPLKRKRDLLDRFPIELRTSSASFHFSS